MTSRVDGAVTAIIAETAQNWSDGDELREQTLREFGRCVVGKVRRMIYGDSSEPDTQIRQPST